jgi:anti-sigma regulatory factor (Ser/Thr protein kinase)
MAEAPGPAAPLLRHVGGLFSTHPELVARIAPMVRDGLERGVPVALAVSPRTADALRALLGDLDAVTLLDHPSGPAARSGQTVAVHLAGQLRELAAGAGPVLAITEHQHRLDGPDGRFWVELEAAVPLALTGAPVDLRCFYPGHPQHHRVLDAAVRNHPALLIDGVRRANPEHRPAAQVLADIPVSPPPPLPGRPDVRLDLARTSLTEVRSRLDAVLLHLGYARDRAEDVVFAINEIATNAVHHGRAPARLEVWAVPRAVVVEVHDAGLLRDPLPGVRPPAASQRSGWGVWVARQTCEVLHVWRDGAGTHVRLHAGA